MRRLLSLISPPGVTALVLLGGRMTALGTAAYHAILPDLVSATTYWGPAGCRWPSTTSAG